MIKLKARLEYKMNDQRLSAKPVNKPKRLKLFLGFLAISGAILYLLISSTLNNLQYFITVNELLDNPAQYQEKNVRISGAVVGSSIVANEKDGSVSFTVAHISGDHKKIDEMGGMQLALQEAVSNLDVKRLNVVYRGIKPDLLKDQSQAIMTGKMINASTFEAEELLLKCPTKYQSASN